MSVKEVTDSMKAREKAIATAKLPVLTEAQIQEVEHKAKVADRARRENEANTALTTALDNALGGMLDPKRTAQIIDKVYSDRKVDQPLNLQAIAGMSAGDARLLIDLMLQSGNLSALTAMDEKLREVLPGVMAQVVPLAIAS
jgi:hypothetical protein